MNKRGVSPLIATVLIIGFTVVLAVLVIAWLSGVFQTQFESEDCNIRGQEYCGQVTSLLNLNANYNGSDTIATLTFLGASGTEPIVRVEILDADGLTLNVTEANITGGFQTIVYEGLNATTIEARASITPTVDEPGVTCEPVTCPAIEENVQH